ncbi:MAG: cell wall-binding repeat-containing protein [Actinomycetaceae bacterium]|nr:cell wall-binding repeat-containing protein [Actinomycetaceae bacterium]
MSTSTVRKFGVGIASLALVAGVTAPAFAADEAPKPLTGGWDRIASDKAVNDRIDTAIAVASAAYNNKAKAQVVYVANSNATIDAAAAGQLTDGPILLVNSDSRVIEQVKAEIAKYTSAKTVYALGGTTVVSDDTLKAIADKKATGRLGGADRYATARAIADRVVSVNPEKGKVVYISRGDVAIDALTAGALDEGPVLLLENGKVPASAKEYLEAKKPTKVIGLGGETVVPNAALSEAQLPGIAVNPGAGYDSYAKALADFRDARTKYLGYNEYTSSTSVTLVSGIPAGTSGVPEHTTGAITATNQAARWMGYKAEAEMFNKRKVDIVDHHINNLKATAAQQLFNLQQTNGGKVTWTQFTAAVGAGGAINDAVRAIYGVDLDAAILDTPAKWAAYADHFVRTQPDGTTLLADSLVTGIVWDKFAEDATYKGDVKVASDAIATYKKDKEQVKLITAANLASNEKVRNSNVLALKTALSTTDFPAAIGTTDTDAATSARLGLVKYTLDELVKIADANAATTKNSMEAAAAKLTGNQKYVRLAGADRYETAVEISKYRRADVSYGGLGKNNITEGGNLNNVYVANGVSMVDALVGGVLTNGPILLADDKGNLSDKTKEELRNIGGTHTTVRGTMSFVRLIGGKVAVPDSTGVAAAAEVKAGNDSKPAAAVASAIPSVSVTANSGTTVSPALAGTATAVVSAAPTGYTDTYAWSHSGTVTVVAGTALTQAYSAGTTGATLTITVTRTNTTTGTAITQTATVTL